MSCLLYLPFPLISNTIAGNLGDSYGAPNALFSGLAFVGVIVTLLMQREELRLQRRELRLTRRELQRSALSQESLKRVASTQAAVMHLSARAAIRAALATATSDFHHLPPSRGDAGHTEVQNEIGGLTELLRELDELSRAAT
jgi:hypothetical protein